MSKKYNDKNGIFPMINTVVWTIFYKIYWVETSNINTNESEIKKHKHKHTEKFKCWNQNSKFGDELDCFSNLENPMILVFSERKLRERERERERETKEISYHSLIRAAISGVQLQVCLHTHWAQWVISKIHVNFVSSYKTCYGDLYFGLFEMI